MAPGSATRSRLRTEAVGRSWRGASPRPYSGTVTVPPAFTLIVVNGPQMDPNYSVWAVSSHHLPTQESPAQRPFPCLSPGQEIAHFCLPPTDRLTVT